MPRTHHPSRPLALTALAGLAIAALGLGSPAGPTDTSAAPAPDPLAAELELRYWTDVEPLLAEFCFGCHAHDKQKGGVRFDTILTIEDAMAMGDDLATARLVVAGHEMPPSGEAQPTEHQRLTIQQWLDDALDYYPTDAPIDPGWFTIHRLNRSEYRNTLRDLLGIDPTRHDLTANLPPDDTGYGFDNIAAVLSVSPLALEAYLDAAERALDLALGPSVAVSTEHRPIRGLAVTRGGRNADSGWFLFSNGSVAATPDIPATADYEIAVTAWGQRAGDELPRLAVTVDGKAVAAHFIEAERGATETHAVRVRLEKGRREIAAAFTNDFYQPDIADRNLAITAITLAGPLDEASIERPPKHSEIFHTKPSNPTRAAERDAANAVIASFAARAFRRPPTAQEITGLLALYDDARTQGDSHEQAVRLALTATLVSPAFLYRSVDNPHPDDPSHIHQLSPHELAARLSYFLWSSMPDDELLGLAESGKLHSDTVLLEQTRRMLADPKADAFIENFAGQWLLLRNLENLDIDTARFPEYTPALRESMITEATMLFADAVRSDRPITALIDSDHTYLNAPLAALYGFAELAQQTDPSTFHRVELSSDSPRGGVLTTAAVLTVTSNPTRTSPVKRGHYVLDQILGTPPPPPPPDIPRLENASEALGHAATLREQLAAHLSEPGCAACHRRMDPIGLAMENFDTIGRWRDADEIGPIDASGTLPDGRRFNGPVELKQILLAQKTLFTDNLTRKLLTYALGRGTEPFDRPTVRRITDHAAAHGDSLRSLIEGIVLSDAFRSCRAPTPRTADRTDPPTESISRSEP
ncbi:MAG: DUF1592 domain-containing protein [Planctomycetota bacterium]|nr:MAG: DUF1592 domain-containing protein [Planctomycetota bacterium]